MKDVPPDYYRRLRSAEEEHWWQEGMRSISAAVLGARLERSHQTLLDAGCGTGGFLAWLAQTGAFDRLHGVDISQEAISLARGAVPSAEFHVASVRSLPFESDAFDVVVLNDVMQHLDEQQIGPSLQESCRVLRADGILFVRTNAGRAARRDRSDWRLYDATSLRGELARAGLEVERLTYANMLLSAWGVMRGRVPRAPTVDTCGVPEPAGRLANAVGSRILRLEAAYLRGSGRALPYGHTMFAIARRKASR